MCLGRQRHRLITHAKVQRKIRAPMPIVLKVASEERLVHINWPSRRRIIEGDRGGLVLEKSSQGGKGKAAVGPGPRELIVLHVFEGKPEFQRVLAGSKEGIIIELVRIPG